jgi:general secretion pathway protein L
VESVHIALGEEVAPKRYLVGVVRHDVMSRWVDVAEEAGLGHAALVPDALALPRPAEGAWNIELANERALARAGDGSGLAIPASLLQSAWQAAGSPPATAYGAPLPDAMMAGTGTVDPALLAAPALDLRQGVYARRMQRYSNIWRRLGWIVALGAAAHVLIATADTLMLRSIADRRADETRALVASVAPGATLGPDLVASVTDMLPSGPAGAPDTFTPLLTRLSSALAPLAGSLTVRAMNFQANTLTMDVDGSDPGLSARIGAALKASRVAGTVTNGADGSIRITASGA